MSLYEPLENIFGLINYSDHYISLRVITCYNDILRDLPALEIQGEHIVFP
jgi:hypothetical protein